MSKESLKRSEERYEKEHKIFCPYCEEEYKDEEYDCISYYGSENGLTEIDCPHCERTFYVEEIVDRTYKTVKCKNCEDEGSVFKTVENEITKVPCKCTKKIVEQIEK